MILKGLTVSVIALLLSACASSIDDKITDSKTSDISRNNVATTANIDKTAVAASAKTKATAKRPAIANTIDISVNSMTARTLKVTGENDGNDFVISWNDVRADVYRVLFWDNDGNVYGPKTTSLSLTITSSMRELGGSVVVEAYDVLDNSVFSAPMNVEAL
ncbi:MAG: ribosomal silencing factor RsfS [Alphaproteobacteria bacterium]|jgi:ribosomal silencing factor RsfS